MTYLHEPTIDTSPATMIARRDAQAWLAEHGFDIADVLAASIRIDHHLADGVGVWLDVDFYLRNAAGGRYPTPDRQEAARGHGTVPLKSWPPLTALAAAETVEAEGATR